MKSKLPWLGVVLFFCDRLTKGYMLNNAERQWDIIPGKLWLHYHLNDQMALSLPLFPVLYYTAVTLVFLILSRKLVQLWLEQRYVETMLVGIVLAGALSNLLDRMLYGGVIDFITTWFGSVFNIADMYIVTGILIWMIILWHEDRSKHQTISTQN
ncbi:MAG: signal peptidase II [Patescibacteria group bacterium]|jgi:signal peptidase II